MSTAKRATNAPMLSNFKAALKSNIVFVNLLTFIFLLLGLVGILNHEMWRDELQAWMISRDSTSIIDLFKNLRYEGHPGLWHLCLYFLAKLTHNPVVMQLFNLTLSAGSIYLFARFSPFTRLQKILFTFGYFSFYEYAIISRSYGLGILFIFTFCTFFSSHNSKSQFILPIIIALLSNTSLYGLVFAVSLQAFLLLNQPNDASPSHQKLKIIGLLIVSLGVGLALLQALPPPSSGIPNDFATTYRATGSLGRVLSSIWRSYIPIPNVFIYEFWNTNILDIFPSKSLKIVKAFLSICLLLFSVRLLAQKRSVLIPYLLGFAGISALNYLNFNLSIRHYGHLFVLFIVYLWLLHSCRETLQNVGSNETRLSQPDRFRGAVSSSVFTLILVIQCIAGVYSFSRDLHHPFSSGEEAARFIKHRQMTTMLVVGSKDAVVSTLSGLLDKKIYYLESGQFGSFVIWNSHRRTVEPETISARVNELLKTNTDNTELLLILDQNLSDYEPGLAVEHLASFSKSISHENMYLYLVRKASPT